MGAGKDYLDSVENAPVGWRLALTNSRRATYIFAGFVLFLVLSVIVFYEQSHIVVLSSYGAVIFGGVAASYAALSRWSARGAAWREVSSSGEPRLTASVSSLYWYVYVGTLIVLSAAMYAAPMVFAPLDVDSPFVGRLDAILPILPLVGTAVLVHAIFMLLSVKRFLGVGLSPEGVYHGSWGGCSFYSWDDVRRFEPGVKGGPGVQLWLPTEFDPPAQPGESLLGKWGWFRRKKNSWLPLGTLAVHPVVVYEALSFYRRHPELRHELGTDAGLERARTANYPDVIEELAKTGERAPRPRGRTRRRS